VTFLILALSASAGFGQESISADHTRGCDTLAVAFMLNNARPVQDYTSVVWNFGDGGSISGILDPQYTFTSPGIYSVRCILDGARVIEAASPVIVGATPYADFEFRDTSANDTEYKLVFEAMYFIPVPGIALDYFWRFPDGTTAADSITVHTFPAEDNYPVFMRLTDENGCADSVTKLVPVFRELEIPNVFSPNGDHINDYFVVTTPGEYIYTCRIFTRAGLQVYYSRSPEISWDGRTTAGREVPVGVYYYVIESEDAPVKSAQAGFIHLFR